MHTLSRRAALALCAGLTIGSTALAQVDPQSKAQEAQAIQIAEAFVKLADEKGSAEARKLIAGPLSDSSLPSMPSGPMVLKARDDQSAVRDQMLPMSGRTLIGTRANRSAWIVMFLSEGSKVGALSGMGRVVEGKFFIDSIDIVFEAGREPYVRNYIGRPNATATTY